MFRVLQSAQEHPILTKNHPNLLAYWTFDKISGTTVTDESPNGNDGTLVNTPTIAAGHIGNGMKVVAANSEHMSVPHTPFLTNASAFSFWVKIATITTDAAMISLCDAATPNQFHLVGVLGASGKLWSYHSDGPGARDPQFQGNTALTAATWHHAVIQSNGTNITMFLDGADDGLNWIVGTDIETLWFGDVISPDNFSVGRLGRSTSVYNDTEYDNVRIFNRVLTQTEITVLSREQ